MLGAQLIIIIEHIEHNPFHEPVCRHRPGVMPFIGAYEAVPRRSNAMLYSSTYTEAISFAIPIINKMD